MCFSAEADIVAGVVATAVGIDTLRHVGHHREAAMAALPIVFGVHQLIEVGVWWAAEGLAPAGVGRIAAWLYLALAFGVVPTLVPFAVRRLETDPRRRRFMAPLVALGAVVAIALTIPIIIAPVTYAEAGNHIAYSAPLVLGGALTVFYVAATCGALLVSSDLVVVAYGAVNLMAVATLAALLTSGVISLWCVWAAVTSVAIAIHLRRVHRQHHPAIPRAAT